jgi:hypothetical protein
MALQSGALRDALIDAGASAEKADKAAEEVAPYERDMADIRADLRLLKWGQSVTFAGVIAILLRVFLH